MSFAMVWRKWEISFEYVDSYAKTFLILYPSLENSTTPIAILDAMPLFLLDDLLKKNLQCYLSENLIILAKKEKKNV